jgi:hypothetical protein
LLVFYAVGCLVTYRYDSAHLSVLD